MRLVAVALLSVALLVPSGASAGTDAAPRRASLLPSNGEPFAVRGSGFRRREVVRVTVTVLGARSGRSRHVRASVRGTFVVAFRGVEPCRGVRGRAVGDRGSRASFVLNSVTCGTRG
jgi:hypothetical protein